MTKITPAVQKKAILAFFVLIAIESLAVALYIASLPRDPKNSLLLGFSLQRLVLMGAMLFSAVIFGVLALRKTTAWLLRLSASRFYLPLLMVLSALFFTGLSITQLPQSLVDPELLAYYERLYPILVWLWIVSLESVLMFTWLRYGWEKMDSRQHILIFRVAIIVELIFLVLAIIILTTGLGLRPDTEGWRKMGSPLLAWQIALAVLAGGILLGFGGRYHEKLSARAQIALDAGLIFILYGLALALWLPQPLQNSYFSPEARPPNNQIYPYSDAMYYGIAAESVTIGEGLYSGEVTPRPFYLTLLSYITTAAGGDYARMITLQSLLLALIPVFLYLVGREIMGRPLGFALGLLGIFRELNAILSTRYIELSNSKMILADLPSLLAILVFTWLLIRWWKQHPENPLWTLGVGGTLGWVMLFRTQAVILLPLVILLLILQFPRRWRFWLGRTALLCAGLLLMIAPWLIRNYGLTGKLMFDDPVTQTQFLQGRYGVDSDDPEASGSILQATLQNPAAVISFAANHFLRNEIATLFVTPPQRFSETVDTLMTEYPFWRDDMNILTRGQSVQLFITLALMALGIGTLFARLRWAGLVPLMVNLAYTTGNALARNSSGRYNLPVDWVGYLYLAAGLLQICVWLMQGMRVSVDMPEAAPEKSIRKTTPLKMALLVGGLLLVGSLIPITEEVFPQRYKEVTRENIPVLLKSWGVKPDQIEALLADPQVVFRYGRELYPRFYKPGVGEGGSNWVAYAPLDFCRMGFVLTGQAGIDQVLVTLERPPQVFPNRADTLVIGKPASALVRGKEVEYIQALGIIQPGQPAVIVEGLTEAPAKCRLQ